MQNEPVCHLDDNACDQFMAMKEGYFPTGIFLSGGWSLLENREEVINKIIFCFT